MKLKKLPKDIQVGQRFMRLISNEVQMELNVTEVTKDLVVCGAWTFDRVTGAEIDDELGWGPGGTGSYLYDFASATSIAMAGTKVSIGGAMRCCLRTLAEQFSQTEYAELGQEHICPHCKCSMKLEIRDGEPTWRAVLNRDKPDDKIQS